MGATLAPRPTTHKRMRTAQRLREPNQGPDASSISQLIVWACLFSSLVAMYFYDEKHEVTLIEKKLAIIGLLLRMLSSKKARHHAPWPTLSCF